MRGPVAITGDEVTAQFSCIHGQVAREQRHVGNAILLKEGIELGVWQRYPCLLYTSDTADELR